MIQEFLTLWENHRDSVVGIGSNLAASVLVVVIGIVLSKGFRKLMKKAAARKHVDDTVSAILRLLVRYGVFIICVIMILNIFGVNTASLIALLGAAGVAIGLALKDTLGNIAAGIILLFQGCYRRGEYVEFGDFAGTVKDINLFTTILETPDGIYISAPNSSVWGSPLKNYSRNGKRRMELTARIAYSDSVETAFQVMRDIAASETKFLPDPAPQVILQSLQDSFVNITVRAWASTQDYWDIYWRQMRNIKEKAEEAGLSIPFPQRDVHIIQKPVSVVPQVKIEP
ncbi:MAG: mechanosensitive ion channel family protein [Treponema sp.]|jgi:small conductance mechanosensitive channel|nr:mechanosensitive ion channel family protein [Treponema sp.]